MSTQDNKTLLSRWYEGMNQKNSQATVDQYLATDLVDHGLPAGFPAGRAGVKQLLGGYTKAFPDGKVTVEDMIAEGDKVVTRLTFRATQTGEFQGIAPTGKPVSFSTIDINRVANGKIVEHWADTNQLTLLQQLGVVPAAAPFKN